MSVELRTTRTILTSRLKAWRFLVNWVFLLVTVNYNIMRPTFDIFPKAENW